MYVAFTAAAIGILFPLVETSSIPAEAVPDLKRACFAIWLALLGKGIFDLLRESEVSGSKGATNISMGHNFFVLILPSAPSYLDREQEG